MLYPLLVGAGILTLRLVRLQSVCNEPQRRRSGVSERAEPRSEERYVLSF